MPKPERQPPIIITDHLHQQHVHERLVVIVIAGGPCEAEGGGCTRALQLGGCLRLAPAAGWKQFLRTLARQRGGERAVLPSHGCRCTAAAAVRRQPAAVACGGSCGCPAVRRADGRQVAELHTVRLPPRASGRVGWKKLVCCGPAGRSPPPPRPQHTAAAHCHAAQQCAPRSAEARRVAASPGVISRGTLLAQAPAPSPCHCAPGWQRRPAASASELGTPRASAGQPPAAPPCSVPALTHAFV